MALDPTSLLVDLIGIDSVNPGLISGAAGEPAIVQHLAQRLSGQGFAVHVVHAGSDERRPSLVAIPPGGPGARTVVLNGHLDTVGVSGMAAPFTARIDGDRLMGRGAADMKGGVAAMVAAAETLAAQGAPVRPVLALVADEEDASLGSEAVIAALPRLGISPEVCIIGEPTDLALARSLRGFAVMAVRFPGRAAHSSQPHEGVNALTHLGRFLAAVDARAAAVATAGGDLMVTQVRGGSSAFVIPDHAECTVERRTAPGEGQVSPVQEIEALLQDDWSASIDLVAARPPWRLDSSGPAATLARALGDRLGTGATFDAPYWMEAPLWQQVAPTLICGPSGGGLHSVDEWVSLDQVRRFATAIVDVLSGDPDAD
ncbi:MAG: M20/M25/M40 family metallo-hydrolase [Actinomycetia bacterium]|nr:M20/M25/M40 family metallo-hydrolase [Actinomycetes bacterium]